MKAKGFLWSTRLPIAAGAAETILTKRPCVYEGGAGTDVVESADDSSASAIAPGELTLGIHSYTRPACKRLTAGTDNTLAPSYLSRGRHQKQAIGRVREGR